MTGMALAATPLTANADTTIDNNTVRVEKNDTLSGIAKKYHTNVDSLAKINGISNVNLIHVNDTIKLTGAAKTNTNTNTNTTNTVNTQVATTQSAASAGQSTANYSSNLSGSEEAAKAWIAQRESGGSYTAQNGQLA